MSQVLNKCRGFLFFINNAITLYQPSKSIKLITYCMKNNYLYLAVFVIITAVSCKRNPIDVVPTCSGAPYTISQSYIPLPPAGNTVKFTRDNDGNVYTAGAYTGTINFDFATLSGGGYFLKKTDANGKILYAVNIDMPYVMDYNINTDSLQNVYLCYVNIQMPYHCVINLDKYNPQGKMVWSKNIAFNMDELLPAVTVNSKGITFMAVQNISNTVDSTYWAGYGTNLYVFDTNGNFIAKKDLTDDRFSKSQLIYDQNLYWLKIGSHNNVLEKLDDKGNVIHAKTLAYNDPQSLYIDSKLNMYLFDTVSVAKMDTAFKTKWTINTPVFNSINSDDKGNLYFGGIFKGTVNFNPGNGSYKMTAKGAIDTYLEKINASGNFVWAIQSIGTDDKDHPRSSSVNSYTINGNGYIFVSGNAPNISTKNNDIYMAVYQQCNK